MATLTESTVWLKGPYLAETLAFVNMRTGAKVAVDYIHHWSWKNGRTYVSIAM